MNTNYVILITILAALLVFLAIYFVAVKLKQKKIDATTALETVSAGIIYAQAIAAAISPFLPSIANNIISAVLRIAQQAVTRSEATYKAALETGPTANDTRAAEATSLVKSGLALEGIEDTAQIDKLINVVIPLLVLALPKTHENADTVPVSATGSDVPTVA